MEKTSEEREGVGEVETLVLRLVNSCDRGKPTYLCRNSDDSIESRRRSEINCTKRHFHARRYEDGDNGYVQSRINPRNRFRKG